MELKRINDYTWEIQKTGKMNVPARIFASEKLLEKIKQDKTLEQLQNVAHLKGIIKQALCMPDAHQGYGFPIGGVAAFDPQEGIVSPGGVGYDINCLTEDTKILTEFGIIKEIKSFEEKENIEINSEETVLKQITESIRLETINEKTKRTEAKQIKYLTKKETNKKIIEVTTSVSSVRASVEHPFLTKEGMKRGERLEAGEEVAINTFRGIETEKEEKEQVLILAKMLGCFMGDGYLQRNKKPCASVSGKKQDLEKIKGDIERLGFRASIYQRKREHRIKTQYGIKEFKATSSELYVKQKEFCEILRRAGMPEGKKTRQEYLVPEWIKTGSKSIKRLFLAGLFGAELSKPRTHTKTGFDSPVLGQNKIKEFETNGRQFLLEIDILLKEFGVKVTNIQTREEFINKEGEKTVRSRLNISSEEDNLLRLWQQIGFEYNKQRKDLANIACLYILKKKEQQKKRANISKDIKEYKKQGFTLKEVEEYYQREKEVNQRFIERHFYETASQRINQSFVSFKEFEKQKSQEIKEHGCIFDKIKSIKSVNYKGKIYDFNIIDNHNFIANNFIVSNCGVRVLRTDWTLKDIETKKKELLQELFKEVPAGVGKGAKVKVSKEELIEIMHKGVDWATQMGYGSKEDAQRTEEYGHFKQADHQYVSDRAIKRGMPQLGSLGAGNHFLEIQTVDKIFDKKTAELFGFTKEDQIAVMIHSGSRGFGHQIASDYIKLMEDKYGFKDLPDRELINAPLHSELADKYIKSMGAAINFAFVNRQMITHWTRNAFEKIMGTQEGMKQVYDVCHNIAKFEEHIIDGEKKKVCIHRKGATRSFGPGREEIPELYRTTGQPVLIPGSMGTASHILLGTKTAEEISFGSTPHGAGRLMSRAAAMRNLNKQEVMEKLKNKNIEVKGASIKGILEEAPEVYKDVDEVVRTAHKLGIGKQVLRLTPIAVIKG